MKKEHKMNILYGVIIFVIILVIGILFKPSTTAALSGLDQWVGQNNNMQQIVMIIH